LFRSQPVPEWRRAKALQGLNKKTPALLVAPVFHVKHPESI
jgi:hypothetical protein